MIGMRSKGMRSKTRARPLIVAEGVACSVYTFDTGDGVVLGRSKTPHKAMRRIAQLNKVAGDYICYGRVYWFADKESAAVIFKTTLSLFRSAGVSIVGSLQSPRILADTERAALAVRYAVKHSNVTLIPPDAIVSQKRYKNAALMRRIGR